jgi:hypothetical protein
MAYDVAVFGTLSLPAKAGAEWKGLDASPAKRRDWADFAGSNGFRGTIADALTFLKKAPPGAWGWVFKASPKLVSVRGVLPKDCFLDQARLIAMLWLRAGEVGGTGTLSFRGFETSDAGYLVGVEPKARVRAMTAKEKKAADAAPEMAALMEAAADLVGDLVEEVEAPPARGKASKAGKTSATAAELLAATAGGKQKDRAAALAQLASVDPAAAEPVVLEWLSDPDRWEDPKEYALPPAAFEAGAAIGTRPCLEKMVSVFVEDGGEWMAKVLSATRGADTATILAAALTAENFRDEVARATDLLRILSARREIGDRAKIEWIARDVQALVAACDLPEMSKADWIKRIRAVTKDLLALP